MDENKVAEILIVDDVIENLKLLNDLLSKEGFVVRQANSGKMALESIKAKHPDLILLDIKMPEMDGYEVCRHLKEDENTASIPVIFLSALGEVADKVHAFETGGVDYVTKPFEATEVLARVRTHLEIYQMKHHLEDVVKMRTRELNNAYVMITRKEEQYRNLVESLQEGYIFYTHDTDGIFTYVSPSIKGVLGYTQDEFLTHYTEYLTDNPTNIKMKEATKKALNGERQIPYQIEIFHKNGTRSWLEITEHPVLDTNLNVSRIEGIARDITSQKIAEEALRLQMRDNKLILESAGEGIFGLDKKGKHTFVNPAAASMLGYREDELIGKPSHQTWHYKRHDDAPYPEDECPIYATLRSGIPAYLGEDYFVRKDGTMFPVTFTSQPIVEDGNVTGAVVSFIDISETVAMEQKLQENEDIMINQSKHVSMGELVGMIAHQWRQPLSTISTAASSIILKKEFNMLDDKFLIDTVESIVKFTEHLSHTIDDFRDFFKPNKEKKITTMESVLNKVTEIIGKSLENHNIELQVSNSSTSQFLTFPNELAHVYINIINNSQDAILGKNMENGKVIVTIEEDGTFIKSTICDNAGGIPKDIIEKIGTRYFTTKEKKGTGLGIYMSKLIIENKMDGELNWYNSEDGACFEIKIPK